MKANDWIGSLRVYEPGKPIEEVARELGFDDIADIVKVASNENELGPSPMAVEAMQEAIPEMHRYPDGGAFYLKKKLADNLAVSPEQILFGDGSNELAVTLMPAIADTTEVIMAYEEKYGSGNTYPDTLERDLSVLGELLESRFVLEDQLIAGLHNTHRRQAESPAP